MYVNLSVILANWLIEQMDGQMDQPVNGLMEGQKDGWKKGLTITSPSLWVYIKKIQNV